MPQGIGAITAADEYLSHQIVNTHAVISTSEMSWTEKVWGSLCKKDGSIQVDFGLGKYTNRNVVDGFGGVSRDCEQWTYRGSRELDLDIDLMGVGALQYEVIKPKRELRFQLLENSIVPVSYDLVFKGHLEPFMEDRDLVLERNRTVSDVVRFHQSGSVSGHIKIHGETIVVQSDEWFGFRDRSWGVRQFVGAPATDLQTTDINYFQRKFHFNWLVSKLVSPDGRITELAYYFREMETGMHHLTGHINEEGGAQIKIVGIAPRLKYVRSDRSLAGGEVEITLETGEKRTFEIEPLARTGFRLHPALYAPWKGQTHGTWKGPKFEDGEYVADCFKEFDASETPQWQLRDRPIRVREKDSVGEGILESVMHGDWPDLLDGEA
ncbi:hypothetical protein [Hyphomonas sp.]|uniref:hypothetical protein n=1 Tax=Hyphomonas sp. TaxID=87 RepID=UPI003F70C92E